VALFIHNGMQATLTIPKEYGDIAIEVSWNGRTERETLSFEKGSC